MNYGIGHKFSISARQIHVHAVVKRIGSFFFNYIRQMVLIIGTSSINLHSSIYILTDLSSTRYFLFHWDC